VNTETNPLIMLSTLTNTLCCEHSDTKPLFMLWPWRQTHFLCHVHGWYKPGY